MAQAVYLLFCVQCAGTHKSLSGRPVTYVEIRPPGEGLIARYRSSFHPQQFSIENLASRAMDRFPIVLFASPVWLNLLCSFQENPSPRLGSSPESHVYLLMRTAPCDAYYQRKYPKLREDNYTGPDVAVPLKRRQTHDRTAGSWLLKILRCTLLLVAVFVLERTSGEEKRPFKLNLRIWLGIPCNAWLNLCSLLSPHVDVRVVFSAWSRSTTFPRRFGA